MKTARSEIYVVDGRGNRLIYTANLHPPSTERDPGTCERVIFGGPPGKVFGAYRTVHADSGQIVEGDV